jgi:hypothetical protein
MTKPDQPWQERPGVWFGLLYRALEEQDFAEAAEAQENLERLGVRVHFLKLPGAGEEVCREA